MSVSPALADFVDSTVVAIDPVERFRRTIAEPDDWQQDMLTARDSVLAVLVSRQVGKSSTTSILGYDTISQGRFVLVLAPSERQSRETLKKIMFARSRDRHSPALVRSTMTEVELINSGRVVCVPQSSDTVRGYSAVDLIVLEEAAFIEDDAIHAVLPSLAEGGRVIAISTPGGKRDGFFYHLLQSDDVRKIIARATEIPRMAEKVEFLRKVLPNTRFRVEVELEWLTDGHAFISRDVIAAAVSQEVSCLRL